MSDHSEFDQDITWLQMGADACRHAGITFETLKLLSTWDRGYSSNAVFEIDGRLFLKIFGPAVPEQFQIERAMLEALAGRGDIPSPEIHAIGETASGLPFLILTRVPGRTAEEVWKEVPRREQIAIAGELGEIVAAINALPPGRLGRVERRYGGRREFTDRWRERLIGHIESTKQVSSRDRDLIIEFLMTDARAYIENTSVVTHRELAHNHIYLDRDNGVWRVTGIIDWADAMLGPEEWDISFIWFWTLNRDRRAMGRFLASRYPCSIPRGLARRCLGAILQTYEGPGLWQEFVERYNNLSLEPLGSMTQLLFPADVFGVG